MRGAIDKLKSALTNVEYVVDGDFCEQFDFAARGNTGPVVNDRFAVDDSDTAAATGEIG